MINNKRNLLREVLPKVCHKPLLNICKVDIFALKREN